MCVCFIPFFVVSDGFGGGFIRLLAGFELCLDYFCGGLPLPVRNEDLR